MIRVAFILACIFLHFHSFAQKDSVFAQLWKRDPIQRFDKTHSNQKQIITAEQIRVSGYGRLSDVLQLSDAFTFTTVNGDRWSMQLNGNYQNQNWILMLDGQRIQLLNFDAVNINTIGVPVNEIERIEIVHTVGNYLGEFTDKGLIHIITKTKNKGISYSFLATNGNEIGDPGPFRFTPQAVSNVDKIGLNYAHTLHANYGKWQAKAIYQYQDYFFRDEQILQRAIRFSSNKETHQNTQTGRLQLIYQGKKLYQQIDAFQSNADDLLNVYAMSSELKIQNELSQFAYLAQYKIGLNKIQFKTTIQNQDIKGLTFNTLSHSRKFIQSNLSYTRNKQTLKENQALQFGMAAEISQLNAQLNTIVPKDAIIIRPYLSSNFLLTKKSNLFYDASLGYNLHQVIPKISVGYYKQPTILNNWSLIASYSERTLAEDMSIFYTLSGGNQPGSSWNNIDSKHQSKQAAIDYIFNINTGNSMKFTYQSSLKYIWDEPIVTFKSFTLNQFYLNLPYVTDDYAAMRWVNRLNFHYDLLKNVIVDFNYMYTKGLNDVSQSMLNIPSHRMSFIVNYSMPKRFNIWSRAYYQSTTQWYNFNAIQFVFNDNDESRKYVTLSNMFIFDMGVSKKLLKDYLNINVAIRNLFNTAHKYHTIGAQFDMTFFVGITGNISVLANK